MLLYNYEFSEWREMKGDTVKPVCKGHLGTSQKCPDYQGVLIFQVSLHTKEIETITNRPDYAGVLIFKCPD